MGEGMSNKKEVISFRVDTDADNKKNAAYSKKEWFSILRNNSF